MNVALRRAWTQEQFLLWVEAQEEPYEFDGSRPVPMTRGNNNHGIIIGNIVFALRSRLGRGCMVLGPESGVTTIGAAIRYPDALVTFAPIDGRARIVPDPVIVFEVLSPSSIRNDRVVKMHEYAAIPSLRRYVIVESAVQSLTILSRTEPGAEWTATARGEGDLLSLPEVGTELPLAEIYDRVTLDPFQET